MVGEYWIAQRGMDWIGWRDSPEYAGIDDLGVNRRVLVGNVGIELHAWLLTILQVYLASELASSASFEVLPI